VTTMGKRNSEPSFVTPATSTPASPTGLFYSGTLSGMRARLYLNSMVAFSAALSAAPRWNEPAWVGVSRGLAVGVVARGQGRAAAHLLAP